MILPLVLPPVVGGVGLLDALGRDGIVGRWLYDGFGIQLTFTTAGAVMAETFVVDPVPRDRGRGRRCASLDPRFEGAAAALGASR